MHRSTVQESLCRGEEAATWVLMMSRRQPAGRGGSICSAEFFPADFFIWAPHHCTVPASPAGVITFTTGSSCSAEFFPADFFMWAPHHCTVPASPAGVITFTTGPALSSILLCSRN